MMSTADYLVLIGFLIGIVVVGAIFATKNKNLDDMFAAGGESPWWAAGLSAFMTMFSAGTFVVWGGIAYKHGLVAVVINLCYGVAALLVGYFVAGHWKNLGIRTPAEFVQLRFGKAALHFYTWSMMLFRLVGGGVALYALAVLMVTLMPLAEGNALRDPATGNLSLVWAIAGFGGVIVVYTMIGGLWGVLMTDVVQSIVINLAVLFVVPLSLMKIGGLSKLSELAPSGFFAPISGGYTGFFLLGWCAIHFFMIGAEWAYVQRYICVPTARDARKCAYLFGVMYLISPLVWLLPPMIWRLQNPIPPGATDQQIQQLAEQAYILSCRDVLPPGMIGLMLAAMFSATASGLSGQLNVFAGVLTNDIYRPLRRSGIGQRQLVWAGRGFTVLLGVVVVALALSVPYIGGAESVVITSTSLMTVPLLAPSIWGLLNPRVNATAVWATAAICIPLGLFTTFGFSSSGPFRELPAAAWIQANSFTLEIILGVILPIIVLLFVHWRSRRISHGWQQVAALASSVKLAPPRPPSNDRLPVLVVGWSVAACAATMAALTALNETNRGVLGSFTAALVAIAAIVLLAARRPALSTAVDLDPNRIDA